MTRAQIIKRAVRDGFGPDVIKEIRRYFSAAKAARGFKWVYGIGECFAVGLPTYQLKSFVEMAREQERLADARRILIDQAVQTS